VYKEEQDKRKKEGKKKKNTQTMASCPPSLSSSVAHSSGVCPAEMYSFNCSPLARSELMLQICFQVYYQHMVPGTTKEKEGGREESMTEGDKQKEREIVL